MSFIRTVFLSGVFLLSLPLLHHAYSLAKFSEAVVAASRQSYGVNFPEAPYPVYAVLLAIGTLLVGFGLYLGIRAFRPTGKSAVAIAREA